MESVLLYLLIGAGGGFLAGLFGIGGGIVIVPLLVIAFGLQGVADELIIHAAIGTSLACIAITAVSSTWAHHQRGAVRYDWLGRLLPGLVVGAVIGVCIGDRLSAGVLNLLLGLFFLALAARMWINSRPRGEGGIPGTLGLSAAGTVIGAISALFGVGGGALTVPFLSWRGAIMTQAVGTSAASGLPIAIIGALTSMIVGYGRPGLPAWSTGYVVWPAMASIVILSVPMARLGAAAAHRLPALWLKRGFAVLLAIVAIKFLV
ncbi:sulfite exporter TauE/SafE family protein [Salinisphaera sp. Q1T1-3]|uniref:sulfite exporter TauE/SafE family protein n=1 Tax=Salinisphaera sp. Q1T1-3 TaxID=2321229 RepID=UPI000E735A6E|nr:sulfite exporter TauE/SafE family protein [Salinisphaera sp. Q1T1-3]RJS95216.1 sulfite exporter TauE/SafE family protein [Salinisphaera sp. Q1T1-3]